MQVPPAKPKVLVIGGPNGAGKSTCAEEVLGDVLGQMHFVNADTIARGLTRFRPESVAVEAGRLMVRRLRELSSAREDFAFEATLAGRSFARFLSGLVSSGYTCGIIYVAVRSPDLAVERVAARVAGGGHAVPELDIRRRFGRSLSNFFGLYAPLAHRWRLYDNSGSNYVLVAQGGKDQPDRVLETEMYDALKRYAPG